MINGINQGTSIPKDKEKEIHSIPSEACLFELAIIFGLEN